MVEGAGSFLSFLLIGHPGIDSGVSSTPKHVHVPQSHETPLGYSPLTSHHLNDGKGGLLPWQMQATPEGGGENILPQVQKQSPFTSAIILSAIVAANIHTV